MKRINGAATLICWPFHVLRNKSMDLGVLHVYVKLCISYYFMFIYFLHLCISCPPSLLNDPIQTYPAKTSWAALLDAEATGCQVLQKTVSPKPKVQRCCKAFTYFTCVLVFRWFVWKCFKTVWPMDKSVCSKVFECLKLLPAFPFQQLQEKWILDLSGRRQILLRLDTQESFHRSSIK